MLRSTLHRRTNCALEALPTIGPQLDIWLGFCFASWLRSSLGRLGWGFIIALQPPVNRADPPDILSGPLFRAARPPEIRIQQSANYGLPLINQVRIVVHCPVPLLSSQYSIRNRAIRGDIPRHNQKRITPPRIAPHYARGIIPLTCTSWRCPRPIHRCSTRPPFDGDG
jgi:hypothetical protein